jgi:ABC transporter substrate binding protein (PQQ-dependent alcohol dehydrogenase system)
MLILSLHKKLIQISFFSIALLSSLFTIHSAFSAPLTIDITYLKLHKQHAPALSNILKMASDSGYQGAKLAINDSNTTGKFLQQHFTLASFEFTKQQDLLRRLKDEFNHGKTIFILDATLPTLKKVDLWAQNKNILLFNISEFSNDLRSSQCLNTILHTAPSNAMKSDALAQWLLYRRLNKVLLIRGDKPEDIALSKSFKRSAKRYGLKVISEKVWNFNTDLRRSAQQEIPLFTQTSKDYDVVYVADQTKDFAEYIPFNTYLPRPVVGSAGLEALSWHTVIEQWGAAQLQTRFNKLTSRYMNEIDFNGYLAVRTVAQAVHISKSIDVNALTTYINSADFQLAAYKGRKLSFRDWNGQLRMPIALIQPHGLVSQSPQAGILHPTTELDTLGFDRQESKCNAN